MFDVCDFLGIYFKSLDKLTMLCHSAVMRWRTKLIIEVEIEAYSLAQTERRWANVLEKIKYQSTNVKITPQLEPNWMEIHELGTDQPTG